MDTTDSPVTGEFRFSISTPPLRTLSDLNQDFYRSYPRAYFWHTALAALSVHLDSRRALAPLLEGQKIVDGGPNLLQLQIDEDTLNEDLDKSMKLQIGNVYYHALETLVRLFLAHGPATKDSPWLELGRESVFQVFKGKKVTRLAGLDPSWTGEHPGDDEIQYVFAPVREPDETTVERLGYTKEWIVFAAKQLLDTTSYNAFKHGLAVQTGEESFAFYNKDSDPRLNPEATPYLEAGGDALIVLEREKTNEGHQWIRRVAYLRLNERLAILDVATKMINVILTIGEGRFVTGKVEDQIILPHFSPDKLMAISREGALSFNALRMELGMVDPAKPHTRKRKKR